MKSELWRFLRGFTYAANGIRQAILQERNFRFHLCAAFYVVVFARAFYALSAAEWAVLWLCLGGVLGLELVNSAVERAVDKPDPQHDRAAGAAKDLAAGAVLTFATATVAVAFVLFWQPERLTGIGIFFGQNPLWLCLLLVSFFGAGWFVFGFQSKG